MAKGLGSALRLAIGKPNSTAEAAEVAEAAAVIRAAEVAEAADCILYILLTVSKWTIQSAKAVLGGGVLATLAAQSQGLLGELLALACIV